MIKNIVALPDTVVNSISDFIKEKRIISDPLIKDSIFSLLEEQCTVLYYPQDDEENDGFHVQRIIKNNLEHFVYINTHKAIEKQVFTAAHELGHIMQLAEYLTAHCKDYSEKYEENCMNRFAADILMPKDIFLARVRENYKHYSTENNSITKDNLLKFSIYLMDYFLVPFKAVLIRLFEIEFLQKNVAEEILNDQKILEEIGIYIKNLGYKRLGIRTEKKSIKDFPELLNEVQKKNIFSQDKLDLIRQKMDIQIVNSQELQTTVKISEPKPE